MPSLGESVRSGLLEQSGRPLVSPVRFAGSLAGGQQLALGAPGEPPGNPSSVNICSAVRSCSPGVHPSIRRAAATRRRRGARGRDRAEAGCGSIGRSPSRYEPSAASPSPSSARERGPGCPTPSRSRPAACPPRRVARAPRRQSWVFPGPRGRLDQLGKRPRGDEQLGRLLAGSLGACESLLVAAKTVVEDSRRPV